MIYTFTEGNNCTKDEAEEKNAVLPCPCVNARICFTSVD